MDFPRRVFDGEGVRADVDFGPTLMLNRNRCILCTRCVRFMREVDGDAQIGIVDRGNGSEIATFNEQGVHSLLSGNLMDVCPVGAITTRQYRFRSRPWDNPHAVDTICTLCSKGCNTTAWIKAKPEWAKGSRLIRVTPRYNEAINNFWMCDIGRFQYTWVEGDARLRKPLILTKDGVHQIATWKDALVRVRDLVDAAGRRDPAAVRFLASAHASHEELFLIKQMSVGMKGDDGIGHVHVTWRRSEKHQPADTKFRVPAMDAPNVKGAQDLGLDGVSGCGWQSRSQRSPHRRRSGTDRSALRCRSRSGWIARRHQLGDRSPQGRPAARRHLPRCAEHGARKDRRRRPAWRRVGREERDATPTTRARCRQRRRSSTRRVKPWTTGRSSPASLRRPGLPFTYKSSAEVRAAIAQAMAGTAYEGLVATGFNRPLPLKHWLQASNPMERWKWNMFFQDLPPVKGHNVQMESAPQPSVIPLKLVTEEISSASE